MSYKDYGLIPLDWKKYYHSEEYKSQTTRASKCSLHFLIGLDQSDSTILPYIKLLKGQQSVKLHS